MTRRLRALATIQDRRPALAVGLLVLFGAVLRLVTLGAKDLWFDEAVLFWIASGSAGDVVAQNAAQNSAPPTFALLVAAVARLAGTSEEALRFLPAVAGILSIPATWLLAREYTSNRGALLAAALVAVARSQLQYAQQLREYSIAYLVAVLMTLAVARWLREPSGRRLVAVAATFAAGILIQYGLALLALALNVVVLLAWWRGRRQGAHPPLAGWAFAQLPALLAVAVVWVLALRAQMAAGGFASDGYLRDAYFQGTPGSLAQLLVTNTHALLEFAFPSAMLLFALVTIGLLVAARDARTRPAVALLLVPLLVTIAAALFRLYPYLGDRQCIFLLPMVYVATALALEHLARVGGALVAVPVGLALALSGVREAGAYLAQPSWEPMRPMVAHLDSARTPGEGVYAYYGAAPAFRYYYRKEDERLTLGLQSPDFLRMIPKAVPAEHEARWLGQLDSAARADSVLWLVFTHPLLDERERMLERVARTHRVRLERQPNERSWLYRAERAGPVRAGARQAGD